EVLSLEAGAADQGAVHVGHREEFAGIRGFHRAAVKDADVLPGLSVTHQKLFAEEAVHLRDIVGRGREPAPDGPDRLIREGEGRSTRLIGKRAYKLTPDGCHALPSSALGSGLADADDGKGSRPAASQRLGAAARR